LAAPEPSTLKNDVVDDEPFEGFKEPLLRDSSQRAAKMRLATPAHQLGRRGGESREDKQVHPCLEYVEESKSQGGAGRELRPGKCHGVHPSIERHALEGSTPQLPACGWTPLGFLATSTPRRYRVE
jgi:hypothetical protein